MLLLVDDEPVFLRLMARLLEREYPVRTAMSARGALTVLSSQPGAVAVVSDLRLGDPVEDGVWLLSEVAVRWPRVRRVLLTGEPTQSAMTAQTHGTIHRVLRKPAPRRTLMEAVEGRSRRLMPTELQGGSS